MCVWLAAVALLAVAGCKEEAFVTRDKGETVDGGSKPCTAGELTCSGNTLQACQGGVFVDKEQCPQSCSATLRRCAQCDPGRAVCRGNDVVECGADGKLGAKIKTCPGTCAGGVCDDPCSKAEASRSYLGCSYWPTVTINSQLNDDFSFAVVVANPGTEAVQVTVSSASNPVVAKATVNPNALTTIKLPWVASLKQRFDATKSEVSILEPAGAYHLVSSLPVTVYQFNALEYRIAKDCTLGPIADPTDGQCFSFSNDASLLLPEQSLSKEYMVISRPSMSVKTVSGVVVRSPGFLAVTAPKEGPTKVSITFTANTQAGAPGGLAAYSKGQTATFDLPRHGVLQIVSQLPASCTPAQKDSSGEYCDLSADTDLTGTTITADKDVAVFAGHNCTFIPLHRWACDHLEEQMFPTRAWGKHYLGSHTLSSGGDPTAYRIISADNKNEIRFTPPIRPPVVLDAGQFVELVTTEDFEAQGTGRFAMAQFMVGQNFSNPNPGLGAPGDPSMALAVPVEQYRTTYRFLAPETYEQNYVNILAPAAATVKLDGQLVDATSFKAINGSTYKVAKLKIGGGSHGIESSVGCGITVYGVGSYTSYMVPGGLDLQLLY